MKHLINLSSIVLLAALFSVGCKKDKEIVTFRVSGTALTNISADGAEKTFDVESSVPWTVTGAEDWCKVEPQSGTGGETVAVTISENTVSERRNALLTVRADGFDPVGIPVSQLEKPAFAFTAEAETMTGISPRGATKEIAVTSDVPWTVTGATDWCRVGPKSGTGSKTVTVTIFENSSSENRSTALTFSAGGYEAARIEVSQRRNDVYAFKDDNFRNWFDEMYHGLLDADEVTILNLPNELILTVRSVEGIEVCQNLEYFDFTPGWTDVVEVETYDFSVLPKLRTLRFTNTTITSFSLLKSMPALTDLNISLNHSLATVDLSGLTGNLVHLYCNNTAIGPEFDISSFPKLVDFTCTGTNIKTLYVWWDPEQGTPEQFVTYDVPKSVKLVQK